MIKKVSLLILIFYSSFLYAKKDTFGIALNLLRPTMAITAHSFSITGTLNYFKNEHHSEISIPWLYQQELQVGNIDGQGVTHYSTPHQKLFMLGVQYKKYFYKYPSFFYGGLLQYAQLQGKSNKNRELDKKQHKFGIGVTSGYTARYTPSDFNIDMYWSINLNVGVYFNKNVHLFAPDNIIIFKEDKRFFVDIEFLKFGVEF